MRTSAVNSKYIVSQKKRFEGKFYLNDNSFLSMEIERHAEKTQPLSNLASVFNPPVFKRQFCKQTVRSVPYFQSSDVPVAEERSHVFVFKGQADALNLLVKRGDILVTGFGTIGNTRLVSKFQNDTCYANNVCRIRTNEDAFRGFIYAFLSSKYGISQLNKNASGSVVRYIEAPGIKKTLIPLFPESFQKEVDNLIQGSTTLREQATDALDEAQKLLKDKASLPELTTEDYDFLGLQVQGRNVSCFTRNKKNINSLTINAFNHSERIRHLEDKIRCQSLQLKDVLLGETFFTTGSFPRIEVKPTHGIMLINQSDIFDNIIKGKHISKQGVKTDNLVEYGEVLIAGVGTLGENETFCRTIFAYEDLVGQLVSGEFLRMKTNGIVPSGYLYTWLSSDYGFRLIRNTQTGTKLCRPIQKMLLTKPIPIIGKDEMNEIDRIVRESHSKKYMANEKERKAIKMVEEEIEKWNN